MALKPEWILQSVTFVATEAMASANIFVGVDGAKAGAGETALGVLDEPVDSGDVGTAHSYGVVYVLSGAAVTAGARVEIDAASKAIDLNTGIAVGTALDGSSGADELIRVKLG